MRLDHSPLGRPSLLCSPRLSMKQDQPGDQRVSNPFADLSKMKAHFMFAWRVSFFHPKTPGKECFGVQKYHSGKSTSLYKLAWGKSSCVFVKILKYIYIVHQMNHTCVCAKTLRWERPTLPGVFSMAVARMLCLSIMFAIGQLGNKVIDISTSPSGDNVQAPPKQRRRGKAAFIWS